MNLIIEEAMTNLIKRVNAIEEEVNKLKSGKQTQTYPKRNQGTRLASDAQIKFARRLGGDPWEGITFEDVSKMINEGKARKNNQVPKKPETGNGPINNTKGYPGESFGCQTPLTKEEIEELGEGALL